MKVTGAIAGATLAVVAIASPAGADAGSPASEPTTSPPVSRVIPSAAGAANVPGHNAVQAQAGGTVWGCDYGWVCIYGEGESKELGHITNRYFKYGTYNLQNQFNYHDIVNNQYGHATVSLCRGYNGTNCDSRPLQSYDDCECGYGINLTPINSIKLNRP